VEIFFRKASQQPYVFYEMRLEQVKILSYSENISENGNGQPVQQISFSPSKIYWTYRMQNHNGTTTTFTYGWNIATNSPI
jgi:type VI protein secretion system component Hcp